MQAWKDSNLQLPESESGTLSFELHALFIKLVEKTTNFIIRNYSKSLRFGFREGSFDKNPKINNELKKDTVI